MNKQQIWDQVHAAAPPHTHTLSNSYLPLHREPHYIINTFLGVLPCPRFTQHTLHLHSYSEQSGEKIERGDASYEKGANRVPSARFTVSGFPVATLCADFAFSPFLGFV